MNNPNLIRRYLSEAEMLKRSYWYGPNLATILTRSDETNGAFSLVKTLLRKGFDPPLHMHTREEESNYVLQGEILYTIGESQFLAKPGDYIHLPRNVQHTFQLISETAETLLIITPGGFEEMFIACGRPASALELPALTGKPPAEFFKKLQQVNSDLGVTIFPSL